MTIRTSLTSLALAGVTVAAVGCSDDSPEDAGSGNPPRLWFSAVELTGIVELTPREPEPY